MTVVSEAMPARLAGPSRVDGPFRREQALASARVAARSAQAKTKRATDKGQKAGRGRGRGGFRGGGRARAVGGAAGGAVGGAISARRWRGKDASLIELGLDSLGATELPELGVRVLATLLFSNPSVSVITGLMLGLLVSAGRRFQGVVAQ